MPFSFKVQPFDPGSPPPAVAVTDNLPVVALKPLPHKSRIKRLLDRRQSRPTTAPPVAATPPPDRAPAATADVTEPAPSPNTAPETEPSSLCLSKMVHNFLEGNNDRPARCGRRRCSCFNGSCDDSSDDEVDSCAGDYYEAPSSAPAELSDIVKSLVCITAVSEQNLSAEVCKIMERTRVKTERNDISRRKMVADGLAALGYDASVCRSRWEKSESVPEGEYEYIDVILEPAGTGFEVDRDRRFLIDIDFRSEFQIARATKRYRAVLQSLPAVFVGRADRLQQLVAVVSEAARQSLKKRGLHVPPWRKSEYMKAKWLSPYQRKATTADATNHTATADGAVKMGAALSSLNPSVSIADGPLTKPSDLVAVSAGDPVKPAGGGSVTGTVVSDWQPPAVTPKPSTPRGVKLVTGLASVILSEKEIVDG